MTKPIINSYKDLMDEKARLKANIKKHKSEVKNGFNTIKEELNPIASVAKKTRDVFTSDFKHPIIGLGVAKATDLLIKKIFLKNAGWLPRLIAPFLVKKISTYLIATKEGDKIADFLHGTAEKIRSEDEKQTSLKAIPARMK